VSLSPAVGNDHDRILNEDLNQSPSPMNSDDAAVIDVSTGELTVINPAASIDSYPKTAFFSEFIQYFEHIGHSIGTMIGRHSSRFFKNTQFEKLFPGRVFEPVISKGTLYCIVNPKHGIMISKDDDQPLTKFQCSWTMPFKFDLQKKVYVVIETAPSYCPDHSHPINRHALRASSRRLIKTKKR